MKKKTVKKYAHELMATIQYYGYGEDHVLTFTDDGYPHCIYYDRDWQGRGRIIKGKRARQLVRDEVIAYIEKHINAYFMKCGEPKFNARRKYILTMYRGTRFPADDFFTVHRVDNGENVRPYDHWKLIEGESEFLED